MGESIHQMRNFLKNFCEEIRPIIEEECVPPKIIGNYFIHPGEIHGQIIDWIFHYLTVRKCPHQLATVIARKIADQINTSVLAVENKEKEELSSSAALYSDAINMLPSICSAFLEETVLEETCLAPSITPYTASVFAIKNKRRKMEDRHVIYHDLNAVIGLKDSPPHSYYAVFDGHSGIDAASYASAQLHINIVKHTAFFTDTSLAIIEAYKLTDENFLKKCSKENMKSGCTAVSALIRGNTVYLSWLGDSQAVLVKNGKPVAVTNPHKPDREDERKRIEHLGGHITHVGVWRVNGILAVTRALGDPDHKPYVSNEPELYILNLDGNEDFLILACDGLWDGMSPDDVTSALYYHMSDTAGDELLDTIAAKLVHQSKLQGSEDNITAVVIFLRDINSIKENSAKFLTKLSQKNIETADLFSNRTGNSEITCAKPTVLELSGTSSKKMKNAANVLNSTGFGTTLYSCQNNINISKDICSENVASDFAVSHNGQSVPQQKAASYFGPEATALSELPTPPIDDVLASQKFESFSPSDLCKELTSFSPHFDQQCTSDSKLYQHQQDINIQTNSLTTEPAFISNCDVKAASNQGKHLIEEENHNSKAVGSVSDGTLNDTIGIASSVVSDAIKMAVECLSSERESFPSCSSHKLNPCAEPFVMNSAFFTTEEISSQKESLVPSDCVLISNDLPDVSSAKQINTKSEISNVCDKNICSVESNTCTDISDGEFNKSFTISQYYEKSVMKDENELMGKTNVLENHENNLLLDNKFLLSHDENAGRVAEQISDTSLTDSSFKTDPVDEKVISEISSTEILFNMDHSGKSDLISFSPNADVTNEKSPVTKCDNDLIHSLVKEKQKVVDISSVSEVVPKDSVSVLNVQEEKLVATEVDEHAVEELHVEAVDLRSVPDGVPEAEGVTEDVDSDSEKDGGWSYMKGDVGSADKSKPNSVSEVTSNLSKGEIEKSKMKSKVERKALDIKDKSKFTKPSTLIASSKICTDKMSRMTLTASRPKKEVNATKVSSVTSSVSTTAKAVVSRISKPTAQKGVPFRKVGTVSNTDHTQAAKGSVHSNISTNLKTKIAETKQNRTVVSTLPKSHPSSQSNKSATLCVSSNRPVSTKISLAPKPLLKPTDLRTKQSASTIKSTVAQNPDGKESKNNANKHISSRPGSIPKGNLPSHVTASTTHVMTSNCKSAVSKTSNITSTRSSVIKKDATKMLPSKVVARKIPSSIPKDEKAKMKKTTVSVQSKTNCKKEKLTAVTDKEGNSKETGSQQEKFILETKETAVKEQDESSPDTNQKSLENDILSQCGQDREIVVPDVQHDSENL